jgi:hypothetical protein
VSNYVKSSPVFFRLIKWAFAAGLSLLLGLAFLIPAPLLEPADISRVPNPSKSAWFLLWTQELVSYSNGLVYLILFIGVSFCLLPWLPGSKPAERALWFPREQRWVSAIALFSFVAIVALTLVAMFFRGENWALVFNF